MVQYFKVLAALIGVLMGASAYAAPSMECVGAASPIVRSTLEVRARVGAPELFASLDEEARFIRDSFLPAYFSQGRYANGVDTRTERALIMKYFEFVGIRNFSANVHKLYVPGSSRVTPNSVPLDKLRLALKDGLVVLSYLGWDQALPAEARSTKNTTWAHWIHLAKHNGNQDFQITSSILGSIPATLIPVNVRGQETFEIVFPGRATSSRYFVDDIIVIGLPGAG
jgi:hypothetical protein